MTGRSEPNAGGRARARQRIRSVGAAAFVWGAGGPDTAGAPSLHHHYLLFARLGPGRARRAQAVGGEHAREPELDDEFDGEIIN
jgi:hypothetical protein